VEKRKRIQPIYGLHPLALGTTTDNRCPASTRLNAGEQGLLGLICGYASRGGRTRLLAEYAALFRPTPLYSTLTGSALAMLQASLESARQIGMRADR